MLCINPALVLTWSRPALLLLLPQLSPGQNRQLLLFSILFVDFAVLISVSALVCAVFPSLAPPSSVFVAPEALECRVTTILRRAETLPYLGLALRGVWTAWPRPEDSRFCAGCYLPSPGRTMSSTIHIQRQKYTHICNVRVLCVCHCVCEREKVCVGETGDSFVTPNHHNTRDEKGKEKKITGRRILTTAREDKGQQQRNMGNRCGKSSHFSDDEDNQTFELYEKICGYC